MIRKFPAVAVVVTLTAWSLAAAQAPVAQQKHHAVNEKAAKTVNDCMIECEKCAAHCAHMVMNGQKEHFRTMQLCNECGAVCGLTHKFIYCQSPVLNHQADACAKICDACADACEKAGANDAMMKKCAQMCRECATACRTMGKAEARPTAN